jgi:anti-sigma-K factor RskA
MNELTCVEVEELIAAYAIDALLEEERCAFTEHLAECRLHDEELAGYRSVTARLPDSVSPADPPAYLRDRVLADFDAMVAGAGGTRARPRPGIRRVLSSPGFAYGIAAALLILAIGLGVIAATRGGGEDVTQIAAAQDGRSMRLVYLPDEKVAVFEVSLPPPPPGRTYQAWKITGGTPVSLGILTNPSGVNAFNVDLDDADAIAFSEEPAGGSLAPTTTPFLVQEI